MGQIDFGITPTRTEVLESQGAWHNRGLKVNHVVETLRIIASKRT